MQSRKTLVLAVLFLALTLSAFPHEAIATPPPPPPPPTTTHIQKHVDRASPQFAVIVGMLLSLLHQER